MVLIAANKPEKLIHFRFINHVKREEVVARRPELEAMIAEFNDGFRLMSDLTQLTSMDRDCMSEIGKVMELCEAKGLETVVRVIPDPSKDIGLNILTQFHYSRKVRAITCSTLEEAVKILGI